MIDISPEDLFVFIHRGNQQTRLLKPIQLEPYGVGRLVEFGFQSAQIAFRSGVQKEPEKQLNAGFICY